MTIELRTAWLATAALALALGAGCGSSNKGNVGECTTGTDFDGDGYGDGCEAGPDCNDFDPSINTDCCSAGAYTGCPCDPAVDSEIECFEGPEDRADTAPCRTGMRMCNPTTNAWSACGGQVLPKTEVCDLEDNDCDSNIDEGVSTGCTSCMPGCDSAGVDQDPFPFPPDDPNVDADGVGLDPNGDLVLDSSTIENHFLWIANDPQGTVSKIDTRTGQEVARYASVTHDVCTEVGGGSCTAMLAWNVPSGNRPSRTAVDFRSDVWVANRAHNTANQQPSATKVHNAIDDCTDRNGNSTIDTSSDVNGNGVIDINDPAEFFAEQDECIAFTVAVGPLGANARAVAIDAGIEPGDPGNAWVGMYNEYAFYQLDGKTGALIQRVPQTGGLQTPTNADFSPYGAAIDSAGRLWASHGCCNAAPTLIPIQTTQNPATVGTAVDLTSVGATTNGRYGIVVDQADRIWIGGWDLDTVHRYDPAVGTAASVTIPDTFSGNRRVRGVGIDTHGNVWAAVDDATDRMVRIDSDALTVTGEFPLGNNTANPIGIGVDFDGDVWTVNQGGSSANRLHIDQTTLEPAAHPDTGNQMDSFPTGPSPYTYSDFTGLGLRVVTRPTGDYTVPIQGCEDLSPATWQAVLFDATTPPNTLVEIWVRVGDDLATLSSQPIYGPWTVSPADLALPPGPVPDGVYMELTIRLISVDGESTPIVHSYSVEWLCPFPDPG